MGKYLITTVSIKDKSSWGWGDIKEYRTYIQKFEKEHPMECELKELLDNGEIIIMMQQLYSED